MKKNGVDVIHLATGMLVGYPPCPYIDHFKNFIPEKYDMKVVVGTHPIPEKYFKTHDTMGTWNTDEWMKLIEPTLPDVETRLKYD